MTKENNEYYVYILASKKYGTLYVGITNNILERLSQHKLKINSGFTQRYHINKLVYFEKYSDPIEAINREKLLKKWRRDWKINLIENINPHWIDLYYDLVSVK